jgi:hypothetical protein
MQKSVRRLGPGSRRRRTCRLWASAAAASRAAASTARSARPRAPSASTAASLPCSAAMRAPASCAASCAAVDQPTRSAAEQCGRQRTLATRHDAAGVVCGPACRAQRWPPAHPAQHHGAGGPRGDAFGAAGHPSQGASCAAADAPATCSQPGGSGACRHGRWQHLRGGRRRHQLAAQPADGGLPLGGGAARGGELGRRRAGSGGLALRPARLARAHPG